MGLVLSPFTLYVRKLSMLRTCSFRASNNASLLALSLQLLVRVPRATPAVAKMLHTKARQDYQGGIKRFPVPNDKVPWSVDYPGYQPVDYSAPVLYEKRPWADPDIKWVGCIWEGDGSKMERVYQCTV